MTKSETPRREKNTANQSIYQISKKETVLIILKGFAKIGFVGYLFYNSLLGIMLLLPSVLLHWEEEKKMWLTKQKARFNLEFKDALVSMTAALGAGYSVENSIVEAKKDLECMYASDELICKEFRYMIHELEMNKSAEHIFFEFAKRTDIEDINNFAWVFSTAKRSGGDLIKIMKNTSDMIGQKVEVSREIDTLISSKKYEATIMRVIPFAMILYLQICSPGFLDPLYHNATGNIVMSVLLFIYAIAIRITKKLLEIRI